MSERAAALVKAMEKRIGAKAARHAPGLLTDLLIEGYALLNLSEIPSALRDDGILIKVARELETDAAQAATWAAMHHGSAMSAAAVTDYKQPQHER